MSEHTKGPWYFHKPQENMNFTIYSQGKTVAEVVSFSVNEEDLANARLIAAAPDLVDVARCAQLRIVDGEPYLMVQDGPRGFWSVKIPPEMVQIARSWDEKRLAAIAKATGRAS